MLRLVPPLTSVLFLGPIVVGLIGTVLPAFGWMPAIGRTTLALDAWRDLVMTPGLSKAVWLSLGTGLSATLISLLLALGICVLGFERSWMRTVERLLAPILAAPHAALAIGFAFLIAPSGWIVRLISPEISGWVRPPDLVTVHDPFGLSLIGGLVLKEGAFLTMTVISVTAQATARQRVTAARMLGYGVAKAWLTTALPQIYPQLRLPLFAVLAFSLSSVDVALVLGPGNPPTLAVMTARWFLDYDTALYPRAAAAAILQFGLVVVAISLWWAGERLVIAVAKTWIVGGRRRGGLAAAVPACGEIGVATGAVALASLVALFAWSLAGDWPFANALPRTFSGETWSRLADQIVGPMTATLSIGLASTTVALVLALGNLEVEQRARRRPGVTALIFLYAPLLVPQITFLFGVQTALAWIGGEGRWLMVVWQHLLFVFPYVFLTLAEPYRAIDPRMIRTAAALGADANATLLRVKLPILTRPILMACAVGFSVSAAQYLPTLFAGGGRIATLTTEAVTLSAGGDRRVLGVYATLQAVLPMLAFLVATLGPRFLFRNRRGMA